MGKPTGKKKQQPGAKKHGSESSAKRSRAIEATSKALDEDMTIFINMSQELKEEGNKLFQRRDHEGAMLKYDKALKLLPNNHTDVAYLRTNMASCFMQMGPGEYDKAIGELNLALQVSSKYSKALLKRARCYEALNKPDLAFRDVTTVLNTEPNNIMALEIGERIRRTLESMGMKADEIVSSTDYENSPSSTPRAKVAKSKSKKKKNSKSNQRTRGADEKMVVGERSNVNKEPIGAEKTGNLKEEPTSTEKTSNVKEETKRAVKKSNVKEEPMRKESNVEEEPMRTVKFVLGEDIRRADIPFNCSIVQLRETAGSRFPNLEALLIKFKDKEGDLVTITTTEELRWAEASADPQGSIRLYVAEVSPDQDPLFEEVKSWLVQKPEVKENGVLENGSMRNREENRPVCIEDWIVQFARVFQNHVGVNSDACLNLHVLGMKLYAEAMEDTVTSQEAQDIFAVAAEKFQEMTALSLFNWGNVHMSRARKRVLVAEDASQESVIAQVRTAYEWAESEYIKAGEKYKEALKFKPDFYEGHLALGQQQFEQAKLSWYFALGNKVDLETWPSKQVIDLYDSAEDCITKGSEIWEVVEERRLNVLANPDRKNSILQKMGMEGLFKDVSAEEAAEQVATMSSQINLLWGTVLYERSIVEFKLGIELWEDTLETAIERFELAGVSHIDIAVMRKNHCSNPSSHGGLGYDIDEIVQAWNEMCDAKKWMNGIESFRLEPFLRRRVPKLHHILEHAWSSS